MTQTYDKNNVFAKILRGEIPCTPIYQNDHALAFYDIAPKRKVHALVIPKGEYIDAYSFYSHASDVEIIQYHQALKETISQINLANDGFRLISNAGKNGEQEVPHFHTHILGGEIVGPVVSDKTA